MWLWLSASLFYLEQLACRGHILLWYSVQAGCLGFQWARTCMQVCALNPSRCSVWIKIDIMRKTLTWTRWQRPRTALWRCTYAEWRHSSASTCVPSSLRESPQTNCPLHQGHVTTSSDTSTWDIKIKYYWSLFYNRWWLHRVYCALLWWFFSVSGMMIPQRDQQQKDA